MANDGKGDSGGGTATWIIAAALTVSAGYFLFDEKPDRAPNNLPLVQEGLPQVGLEGEGTARVQPALPESRPDPEPAISVLPTPNPTPAPEPVRKEVVMGSAVPPTGFGKRWTPSGTTIELLWVPPGEFKMGSPPAEQHRRSWEKLHGVTLTEGFWLGKYEVSQRDWVGLGMRNKSYVNGPLNPVSRVSWNEAMSFCLRLDSHVREKMDLPDGYAFRLPTEAEWEYACRAGTSTASAFGDSMDSRQANFDGRFPLGDGKKDINRKRPMPVGYYPPNPWGFHEMHGNVWEWCLDSWRELPTVNEVDPAALHPHAYKVAKGGSWYVHGWECRSTCRHGLKQDVRYRTGVGLRVCLGRVME